MKNSALIWTFIIGIVVAVLFAFNYQGNKNKIPLSEIFPEESTFPVDVEYEFVDQEEAGQHDAKQAAPQEVAKAKETAQVEIQQTAKAIEEKVVVPATVKEDLTAKDTSAIPFTIQVASFRSKDAAEDSLKKVNEKGYKGYIVSKNLGDKGTWHRVYVGVFKDKPQADTELSKVQKDYPNSFVIAPK